MTGSTTIHVCVTCRHSEAEGKRPGALLHEALGSELAARGILDIVAQPVECLSVCKRPCTIAFAGVGKWTYVIGDLNAADHVADIITGAERYHASANGIVPWRERPVPVRRGVVARVPPIGVRTEDVR
jgi:predicted metal-binding protein